MDFDEDEVPAEGEGGKEVDNEIKAYEEAQRLETERQKRDFLLKERTKHIYDVLYKDYPYERNAEISRGNRQELGFGNIVSLSYSQASYEEILKVLQRLTRLGLKDDEADENKGETCTNSGNFIDLGSGTGSVVYAAALAYNFHTCTGIEILPSLNDVSNNILINIWNKKILNDDMIDDQKKHDIIINFYLGDCCYTNFTYGDIIYFNATCYDNLVISRIEKKCWELKPGTFLIMITKKLPNTSDLFFDLIDDGTIKIKLNWGIASVYYYKRNRMPSPNYIPNKTDYISSIIRRKALPVFNSKRAKLLEEETGPITNT